MPQLNVDQIIAARDIETKRVDVPEWGDDAFIYVRGLTGSQLDLFEQTKAGQNIRGRLLSWSLCKEDGTPLNVSPEQTQKLGGKNGRVLTRIVDAILELSGLTESAIEEAEKN